MATLEESIRPLLTRVPADRTLSVSWFPPDEDDVETLFWAQYYLRPNVNLWQLNELDPTRLYTLLANPGVVIHLSNDIAVVFCKDEYTIALCVENRDGTSEHWMAGPEFIAAAQEEGRMSQSSCVFAAVYVSGSSDSIEDVHDARIKVVMDAILRLLTGLPKFGPAPYRRSLSLRGGKRSDLKPHNLVSSFDCLRSCFGQEGWDQKDSRVMFDSFQPSAKFLSALEEFAFMHMEFRCIKVPRSFLEMSRSSRLGFYHCALQDKNNSQHRSCALSSSTIRICPKEILHSTEDIDAFIATWMTTSSRIELRKAEFSKESWTYFWRRLSIDERSRSCTSLRIVQVDISGTKLGPEHLLTISAQSWLVEWEHHGDVGSLVGGTVHARRITSSMSGAALPYFQVHDNPLLGQNPPLDARQSVILEALLRSSDNPDHHFQLARTYTHALLQPRTQAARAHDTETSLVELRALGIDQQSVIGYLLEANNALQQRHAKDGRRILELTRQVADDGRRIDMLTHQLEKEQMHRRQLEQRQLARTKALEEQFDWLHNRLRSVEQAGDPDDQFWEDDD